MPLHHSAIVPLALFALAAVGFPVSSAQAQTPALAGDYVYLEAESDPIGDAIEQAVSGMNFITRPIARGRLTRTNQPYQRVSIRLGSDEVTVTTDDRAPIVARGRLFDLLQKMKIDERAFLDRTWHRSSRFSPGAARAASSNDYFCFRVRRIMLFVRLFVRVL